jgi:ABC-2 type transport system permease protein
MHYLRLIVCFARASVQNEMAYRANFLINLLHTLLNLGTGLLGLVVLFEQTNQVRGWDFPAALALLGIYLALGGRFDFTLLRPVDVQFQASFRHWRPFALIDLFLALIVLGTASAQLGRTLSLAQLGCFLVALAAGVTILYAILLAFSGLVFWSPGFLFTWVFDGVLQMARFPVSLYPGWLRLILTWVVPVGVMTTVPAQALAGELPAATLAGSVIVAAGLLMGASALFRFGLRQYASASS